MARFLWFAIKSVCGIAAVVGVLFVTFSLGQLFFLLTGRVVPDFEQPGVGVVSGMLVFGLVIMIVGYKLPKWLNIDRLL
jgi:hypothetical protein